MHLCQKVNLVNMFDACVPEYARSVRAPCLEDHNRSLKALNDTKQGSRRAPGSRGQEPAGVPALGVFAVIYLDCLDNVTLSSNREVPSTSSRQAYTPA